MNISSLSASGVAPPTAASATSAVSSTGTDAVSDSSGSASHHHHVHRGGGGHLRNAVSEALQSADPDAAANSAANPQDAAAFMHALFEAAKAESPATGSGASSDPKAGLASGLSALITDVGNGSAPAGLQDAYAKIAPGAAPASLQSFLTALQQNLGYGSAAAAATAGGGAAISTQA